jgi:trimethylamine corrinoid protein
MPSQYFPLAQNPTDYSEKLFLALLACDRVATDRVVSQAVQTMSPLECAENVFTPALQRMGKAWNDGEVALAQLYVCGRICEEQLDRLLPESDREGQFSLRVGIAVLADHHALGKRIVVSFLRAAGYRIMDYGLGLDPETLAAKVREDNLQVILVSTLMLPSALQVKRLSELLQDHPVKIVVGGAPFLFDPELWREVGADAMGHNAASALDLVKNLVEKAS